MTSLASFQGHSPVQRAQSTSTSSLATCCSRVHGSRRLVAKPSAYKRKAFRTATLNSSKITATADPDTAQPQGGFCDLFSRKLFLNRRRRRRRASLTRVSNPFAVSPDCSCRLRDLVRDRRARLDQRNRPLRLHRRHPVQQHHRQVPELRIHHHERRRLQ